MIGNIASVDALVQGVLPATSASSGTVSRSETFQTLFQQFPKAPSPLPFDSYKVSGLLRLPAVRANRRFLALIRFSEKD